jgi:ABC-2 type transport system permease protein
MATNTSVSREAVLAAKQGLMPVHDGGPLGGFGNMLGKELGDYFSTRRWIVQSIIWLAIINGLVGFILFAVPAIDPSEQFTPAEMGEQGIVLYFSFSVMFGAVGMIILAQDEIIQERQTGTAAWILTKPVSRSSFILTKLLSNLVAGLAFIAAIPGLVAYLEIYLVSGQMPPLAPYLMGIGAILLMLVFYLTLVIMLGTVFEQRGPVLGVSVTVFIGGFIASQFLPQASYILPVNMQNIAAGLAQSQPLPGAAYIQLGVTAAWSVLFTIVALWRFSRLEL